MSDRKGTKRSFLFLSVSSFSNLFWLELRMVFFNFLNFFSIFFEFSITLRVVTKRKDNFYSLFLSFFQPILAWNEATMVFLNFFAIFLEFSITLRVGTKRNDNFYFLSFTSFSNLFWLEMYPQRYVLIIWIFLLFFWNFVLRVGLGRNGRIIFIFSLSHPFPTYFRLKCSHNGIF